MPRSPNAEAFISQILNLDRRPGASLDDVLKPSIEDEAELRRYFATDRGHARLSDPYVGLVDVFDAPEEIRKIRARVVNDDEDLTAKYVMPLTDRNRRPNSSPAMVADIDEFKKNWAVFTEGSLSQLVDWNNVIAAGGSVLACLTPLSGEDNESKRAIRKHYHSVAYPTSDVDLFLWGLNAEQAEVKIQSIYKAVRDSVPWDVTCIRTNHTVSIHSQYPYRSVQIILRLYLSPAEILAGFDVDAPCFAYDGTKIWGNPRAIVAMMRQCNTVDMTRRSPSYEVRLAKYARRGFEVYVPDLAREKVDPTIYERSIVKMQGLARLLVLEKLQDGDARYTFLDSRRQLRGRPNALTRYQRKKRKYKGDLKQETAIGGLEMNDYDVASLHIPYGPGWDARRIDKLVYQTDLGMNSTFNPKNKNRRLHRHPAFFGTMEECIKDCCGSCPKPIDDDEKELQAKETEIYITGRIQFMEENPGRQSMTGSFKPIDTGEWSEQVYVKEQDHFFAAIASDDLEAVKQHLQSDTLNLNNRDHVGRTCLHVAIFANSPTIACELIDAGVRISARLPDGRSALHLAARFDQISVVRKLLERNVINKKQQSAPVEANNPFDDKEAVTDRPSSADDWSSDENDGRAVTDKMEDDDDDDDEADDEDEGEDSKPDSKKKVVVESATNAGDLPEDEDDAPDVFDIDDCDWDFGFTPLAYAVLFASSTMVDTFINLGACATKPTTINHHQTTQLHPLSLTILREDEDEACRVARSLITGGASSTTADTALVTIFHRIVSGKKPKLLNTILSADSDASTVLDFPSIHWSDVTFPILSAIVNRDYSTLAVLLAHGVKTTFVEEDITRARDAADPKTRMNLFRYGVTDYVSQCYMPLESAIAQEDDVVQLLVAFCASVNLPIKSAVRSYASANDRATLWDWLADAVDRIDDLIAQADTIVVGSSPESLDVDLTGWKQHLAKLKLEDSFQTPTSIYLERHKQQSQEQKLMSLQRFKEYLAGTHALFQTQSAKGWSEMFPDLETTIVATSGGRTAKALRPAATATATTYDQTAPKYREIPSGYGSAIPVAAHLNEAYDQLFEACFSGKTDKIKELCLPAKDGTQDESKRLLKICVQIALDNNEYNRTGWTPLYAACEGRQWTTAKLIVAIAASQYTPSDKDKEVHFSTSGVNLDDDSDDEGSYDSDDSESTVDNHKHEEKFIDISKMSSVVQSDVHPRTLITATLSWLKSTESKNTTMQYTSLLGKAVMKEDLEAFINISALYRTLSEPVDMGAQLFQLVVSQDNPEILHECIRRTGYGLDFDAAKKATEHLPPIVNDQNRVYLGLDVHGKKRGDLAKKNDPNATSASEKQTEPLVWHAAGVGSKKIMEYLSGAKPLAAFRYYATHYSDSRAEQLRRVADLEQVLPAWLGWSSNALGDSPLTAAVRGNNIEMIKLLFANNPRCLKLSLEQKIKFGGQNIFMVAVMNGCNSAVLDFLLARGVSPVERDKNKRWNVYHYACHGNYPETVEYLLKKLPRDVTEELLMQTSKVNLNTPLHTATAVGAYQVVKKLVQFDSNFTLVRNIDGQTPLHIACNKGFAETVKVLLESGASQHAGLYMEDGVGQTPVESLWLKRLSEVLSSQQTGSYFRYNRKPSTLDLRRIPTQNHTVHMVRVNIEHLEKDIPRLQEIVDILVAEGTPSNPGEFALKLASFIETLKRTLATLKADESKVTEASAPPAPQLVSRAKKGSSDSSGFERTGKVVLEFGGAVNLPGQRDLVKLFDVQASVKANLDRVFNSRNTDDEDSDAEEDEDLKTWQQGNIYLAILKEYPQED
ncbi:ankyrin repeat protein [Coprinopsis marcescibilis]|uniref:Ankyrin repeat protein n=1 Tax=Coprinopsis marcescibilis TaxID=230819 RepID=A0A5C3KVG7_COPMA|nr:ankyrin repeat protein [Coprinopsis marcescibilis]